MPVHAVMANESILDVAERVGSPAADRVRRIEDARGHAQSGLGACLLDGAQSRFGAIEQDLAPGALDPAEQTVFNGVPLGGVRRREGDAQARTKRVANAVRSSLKRSARRRKPARSSNAAAVLRPTSNPRSSR